MSYVQHCRVDYRGHQDQYVQFGCHYCRYEIIGKKYRREKLFARFAMHLESEHLDKLAQGSLVCTFCDRESRESSWNGDVCPECGALSLLASRQARLIEEGALLELREFRNE